MKLNILLPIVFLLSVSTTYAETRVIDSPQVCQERISAYKSALESAIKEKQNVDAAKAELNKIDKLPSTLSPCEKQKQIPALSNSDEASTRQANEELKDRKISP